MVLIVEIIKSLQVHASFTSPYDSRDIGLMTVANATLHEQVWLAKSQVLSKCLIVPKCRDFEDPLPECILNESDRRAAFIKHFGHSALPTWSVFSLLLPPENTFDWFRVSPNCNVFWCIYIFSIFNRGFCFVLYSYWHVISNVSSIVCIQICMYLFLYGFALSVTSFRV